MARPLRIQYPGAYYHVTCRGNERRKIFIDHNDRYRFIGLLKESLEIYHVILYGYVLMDNHFHLVLQTGLANLSEFMRHFNICYTGWFNYHHKTCGHLYQGRYKALLVDADNYLLELSRYVHLNPVRIDNLSKAGPDEKWQYLSQFQWSSLAGYVNVKKVVDFIDYHLVLDMVGSRPAYQRFMHDGLRKGLKDVFEDVYCQTILGTKDFVALVKTEYLESGSIHEQPSYRDLITRLLEPINVISICSDVLGEDVDHLKQRSGDGVDRGIVADMLYRYCGITQRAIGELLGGIGYTGINMLRCRLHKKMKNPKIRARYVRVDKKLRQFCDL